MTGGAHRLGREIVLALARQGFDVAIHFDSSQDAAEETLTEVQALGRRAVLLRADLADEVQVEQLIPRATDQLGRVGALINNASRFDRDEWDDVTRASWDAHMDANLRAPFVLIQAFAPDVAARRRRCRHQYDRSVGLVADAALRMVHGVEGRPVGVNPDHGAGAGATNSGQCDRSGTGASQPRTDRGRVRPAIGVRYCLAMAPARPRSDGLPC